MNHLSRLPMNLDPKSKAADRFALSRTLQSPEEVVDYGVRSRRPEGGVTALDGNSALPPEPPSEGKETIGYNRSLAPRESKAADRSALSRTPKSEPSVGYGVRSRSPRRAELPLSHLVSDPAQSPDSALPTLPSVHGLNSPPSTGSNWSLINNRCWLLATALLLVLSGGLLQAAADVKPLIHPLFSDNMVLQREVRAPVWGWAQPGAKVEVSINGKSATATADAQGKWMVRLTKRPAGGPFSMKVSGPQTVTLTNVLVGDVWVCSGQSNMEMGIGEVNNAAEEIAAANFENIRLFTVPKHIATEPQALVASAWKLCTPENIAIGDYNGFTAAGYFFGRQLHRELGVPIGLIDSSWGGTVAEAWTSAEALAKMEDFQASLEQFQQTAEQVRQGSLNWEAMNAAWFQKADPGSTNPGWQQLDLDTSGWKTMDLPQPWEGAGLAGFDGIVWFRKTIHLPPDWAGRAVQLHLGAIDDRDTTWVNGVKVGAVDAYNRPRDYAVPAGVLRAGANVIAVRVLDTGGGGGFAGQPDQLRLASDSGDSGSSISLAGPWQYRKSASLADAGPVPQQVNNNPNTVTVLYNGMIAPLLPYAIRGAIWYQGESNASRAEQYQRLLPVMIRDWRARFEVGDFPFFIVQLANFMAIDAQPVESNWAELREAQWITTQTVRHTGLAVAIDIGEADDIHPRNKQEVGRRLALTAEAIAYGRKLAYSGPTYRGLQIDGNRLRISFDHTDGGLVAKGGGSLKGFAIAGKDGKFVWADAEIDGENVIVSSAEVAKPVSVRYGWANNPVCTLYNGAGLPAVPFRSDNPKSSR